MIPRDVLILTTLAMTASILTLSAFFLRRNLILVTVQGASMTPNYLPGDRVLVRRGQIPSVGQVVVVERPRLQVQENKWGVEPTGPERRSSHVSSRPWLLKRVAAVSGDPTPTSAPETRTNILTDSVPNGHLYLLGDNAAKSFDSRQMGFFPVGRVLGVVLVKF
jgi:signal peptidase I